MKRKTTIVVSCMGYCEEKDSIIKKAVKTKYNYDGSGYSIFKNIRDLYFSFESKGLARKAINSIKKIPNIIVIE